MSDESNEMRTKMLSERRDWYLNKLKENVIPENLDEFYTPPPPPPPPVINQNFFRKIKELQLDNHQRNHPRSQKKR